MCMSKNTRLKPDQIIAKADRFFGATGEGLHTEERTPCCVYFAGGGGYVAVTIVEDQKTRTVEIETREFEYQVKQFLKRL